ncbi:MAG TPA: cache domain-containing protein [bacterium]|nr:cache domain-containing protein [bacterium]
MEIYPQQMKHKKLAFGLALTLCLASLAFVAVSFSRYTKSDAEMVDAARKSAEEQCAGAAAKIDERMKAFEGLITSLADDLGAGKLSGDAFRERLKKEVDTHPMIVEIGVSYEPYAFAPDRKLFGPRYGYKDGKAQFFEVDYGAYDYTQRDWYKKVLAEGPVWRDPRYNKTTKVLAAGFVVPFFRTDAAGKKVPAGTVHANLSLDKIRRKAAQMSLGKTGYAFMFSKNGALVYYPVHQLVEEQKTVFDTVELYKGKGKDRLLEAAKTALEGKSASVVLADPATGKGSCVYFRPIPASGWTVCAVFLDDEIMTSQTAFRRQKILMALALIVFFTLLSAMASGALSLRRSGFWTVSIVFSISCLAATCYLWSLILEAPNERRDEKFAFRDPGAVGRFVETYTQNAVGNHKQPPSFIPTGIYIQTLEFKGANDLEMSGYVWQKYTDGVHDGVSRGFILPEAKAIKTTEVYRRREDNTEVAGWYFEATIREYFDYSKYPFDRPDIGVRLLHADFVNNVMLVPDLDGYKFITAQAAPGLQQGLVLPGYAFQGAFFDYEETFNNTNFGITKNPREDKFPELRFNIQVKRNFMTPFISKIFPLLTMLAMLFIVLLMFSKEEERKKAWGISGLAVLGTVVSFFFATLLSQVNLKQELATDSIIFLENFHFIIYFTLFMMALKAFLFMGNKKVSLVQYDNGLIPKLLYWPAISFLLLAISLGTFY